MADDKRMDFLNDAMNKAEFADSPLDLDTEALMRENRRTIEANYRLLRDAEAGKNIKYLDGTRAAHTLYDYELSGDDVLDIGERDGRSH